MDIEGAGRLLAESGKADAVKALAGSEEAKRLSQLLDGAQVERAAISGDAAALRGILSRVLSTEEGRRLTEKLRDAMK